MVKFFGFEGCLGFEVEGFRVESFRAYRDLEASEIWSCFWGAPMLRILGLGG